MDIQEDKADAAKLSKRMDRSNRSSIDSSLNPANLSVSETRDPLWKIRMQIVIDSWAFTIWMLILTIYALFGEDIRISAFTLTADVTFYSITIVCVFFFTLEMTLASLSKPEYWLSFFFWLDLISTLSLIIDIGWVWDAMIGNSGSSGSTQSSKIASAGRASRAGTRASRVIRIVRIIRLIRLIKIYRIAKQIKDQQKTSQLVRGVTNYRGGIVKRTQNQVIPDRVFLPEDSANASFSVSFNALEENNSRNKTNQYTLNKVEINLEEQNKELLRSESKVGKELLDITTRRIIIVVLALLFSVPLFDNTLYVDADTSYAYGLDVMNKLVGNNGEFRRSWDSYIQQHSNLQTPLIYLEVLNMDTWTSDTNPDDLRDSEKNYIVLPGVDSTYLYYSYAIFDTRYSNKLTSELNICQTIFVCIVLIAAVLVLSKDAQILVLNPIENMIEKVKKISNNPLEAAQDQERKEVAMEDAKTQIKIEVPNKNKKNIVEEPMETLFLETTLNKIGALLALGFGEAGSEIIATNMQKGGGEVDPMIAGKKTHCIFGFCDIRDFADATEVLQQEVLVFVNEVAYIVHKTVDFYSGNANKNIGDAFLLVWKFPESVLVSNDDNKNYVLGKDQYIQQLADMSVISFLKIIAEIHKNPKILKYKQHEGLNKRLPGFSVKMGFGLHQGWAIEGAIGSQFKIDASYLSPNVNMASRLEAATKQFGVHILISSVLYEICSQVTKSKLRRVDKVTVKGSKHPIELYTCDVNPHILKPLPESNQKLNMKKVRVYGRIARNKLKKKAMTGEYNISDLWIEDEDLVTMRSTVSKDFLKEFKIALEDYLNGKWTEARAGFKRAQEFKGSVDGPSQVLIDFIDSEGGVAPATWPGYRELHDK